MHHFATSGDYVRNPLPAAAVAVTAAGIWCTTTALMRRVEWTGQAVNHAVNIRILRLLNILPTHTDIRNIGTTIEVFKRKLDHCVHQVPDQRGCDCFVGHRDGNNSLVDQATNRKDGARLLTGVCSKRVHCIHFCNTVLNTIYSLIYACAITTFLFCFSGVPVIVVVAAIIADVDVYGDKNHGFCVISPIPNSVIYYTTYMGPICCMLLVNCIVFVMVTRVLCQRRPHSHKPKSPSVTTSIEFPITLAQVRGAVTVVALLGVTWVAGAISVGWARQILQYIFCLTTPLQGLIIFIVRVAQHPEARAAWIALFTTGTLRRRPPTHSTHSSAHTHSTSSSALTPPRNYHSSVRTVSTRVSPRGSIKPSSSVKRNGSAKHRSKKNGSIHRYTSNFAGMEASEFSISTIFSRLVHRLGSNDLENHKSKTQEGEINNSTSTAKHVPEIIPSTLPQRDYSSSLNDEANFSDKLLQKTYYHNNKNESLFRPQSLVLLRTDNHGSVLTNHPSTFSKNISHQFPVFLSTNLLSQDLLEAGIPASMMPRRSLGSLTLLTEGKEGDDSSWRFVRPPPDGRSDPVNEESAIEPDKQNISQESKKQVSNIISAAVQSIRAKEPIKSSGCVVLSGQRVATNHLVMFSGERNDVHSSSFLTRANSELQMGSPPINSVELRRSASVYTLGEWEDPRSSLA
nr:uncharacterized protein LOC128686329 [Cherax quadricarinatus]